MRARQRFIEPHRLQRIMRWARAFFVWLVGAWAVWLASGGRASPRDLNRVARFTGLLVITNVGARIIPRKSGVHRHGRLNDIGFDRRLIGARLRKLMRGRDFASRLHAILCVMRDLETHVAREMRRLRNGLSRQRIIDPVRCAEACAPQAAPAVAGVDSS